MKKLLTVLLVIAVMFTFSFGSAFATPDPTKVVTERTDAVKKITDAYDDALDALNGALSVAKAGTKNPTDATTAEWNAACDEAYAAVKAKLDDQLTLANQELGNQELIASNYEFGIKGYAFEGTGNGATDGYVYFASAITKINLSIINDAEVTYTETTDVKNVWNGSAFQNIDASKIMYKNALADTIAALEKYDVDQYSKDDKVTVGTETKSSYEWAVDKQKDALAYLGAFGDYGTTKKIDNVDVEFEKAAVEAVYKITAKGTEGEKESGTFVAAVTGKYPALGELKTAQNTLSDAARITYAKNEAWTAIKDVIEGQRSDELKVQNDIIFQQSIAKKPNQKVIDKANEAIEDINEKYDNMLEIFEARFANAEFEVKTQVINNAEYPTVYVTYDDEAYAGIAGGVQGTADGKIGFWNPNGDFYLQGSLKDCTYAKLIANVLTEKDADTIIDNVEKLKKQADRLKATVDIDGATAMAIDEALAEAMADEYMFANKGKLSYDLTDTVVHMHAHDLLGYECEWSLTDPHTSIADKVTVDGKKYDRIDAWTTNGYSDDNTDLVKAIKKEAKAAVKAAETVEAADKAFLDAYAKYDAVLTIAEQKALFNYGGELYKQDTAAKAELEAYIDYKVALLDDKAPATDTAAKIKAYFYTDLTNFEDGFLAEVVDAASLQAAIADVKATVDSLLTKDEMKAKVAELTKAVNAVTRAVELTQEAEVLALYDDVVDYNDYCDMVGYTDKLASQELLLKADIERLADLQEDALDEMKESLPTLAKLTVADKDAVDAYYDAQEVYNDTYGVDGDYADALNNVTDYTKANAYDNKMWELRVEAVDDMIAALPLNPTVAQVKAAQDALDALGFEGLCDVSDYLLTKLSKFTQDAEYAAINAVETLKITAKSTAKKGAITVKWTVKGDADIDGYEIWKSTKQSKGYYKAFTTTKQTYKNTKGLKAGTRYYYKVRAYKMLDGVKYTSDWSNKAYRKAK